jgi:hypothetical protein
VIEPCGDWPNWLQGSRQIPEAERAVVVGLRDSLVAQG